METRDVEDRTEMPSLLLRQSQHDLSFSEND